jgi:hypothetical protein
VRRHPPRRPPCHRSRAAAMATATGRLRAAERLLVAPRTVATTEIDIKEAVTAVGTRYLL